MTLYPGYSDIPDIFKLEAEVASARLEGEKIDAPEGFGDRHWDLEFKEEGTADWSLVLQSRYDD